jgi:hypothetical protein
MMTCDHANNESVALGTAARWCRECGALLRICGSAWVWCLPSSIDHPARSDATPIEELQRAFSRSVAHVTVNPVCTCGAYGTDGLHSATCELRRSGEAAK